MGWLSRANTGRGRLEGTRRRALPSARVNPTSVVVSWLGRGSPSARFGPLAWIRQSWELVAQPLDQGSYLWII